MGAHLVSTVFIVAHNGIAAGGQMHAYLVRTPSAQLGAQQTIATITLLQRNNRMGSLTLRIYLYPPLSRSRQPLQQGLAHMLLVIYPVAHHQSLVMLAPTALTHHVVQPKQSFALLGDQQQTR